ncbi:MAG: type 2 isopentenyl-diphosphate Delta-isomerase [Anaerolineae bacterium]|nr:type 2 isopentenyl-diphosphate Delta-isomerase [Anaerolineae bacterium]
MPTNTTRKRKDEHIDINVAQDVSFLKTSTGLERYRFIHQALPELNLADIDTSTAFLGHRLQLPLLIASVTGGSNRAGEINILLAETAQAFGIGMGLGSMRAVFEDESAANTFRVRSVAPDILLYANLGAVQLNYGYNADSCKKAVEIAEADGLMLHLNPVQEALQPEGDGEFSGLLSKIEHVCLALDVPVIVKEVGYGLSARTASLLRDAGVSAVDVAGAGGTSWSQVEMYRATEWVQREVAASFRDWGIPTADSIIGVRQAVPKLPLIASGGLTSGIDIAKAIALGADIATIAGPILRYAVNDPEHLHAFIEVVAQQLRIAMFASGISNISELKFTDRIIRMREI